jgi:hypothetical protein
VNVSGVISRGLDCGDVNTKFRARASMWSWRSPPFSSNHEAECIESSEEVTTRRMWLTSFMALNSCQLRFKHATFQRFKSWFI